MDSDDDYFLMANISPLLTGLPWVVWILVRDKAKHPIRLVVNPRGHKMIQVQLSPLRVLYPDTLPASELKELEKWISRNWEALRGHWDGKLNTDEAIQKLKETQLLEYQRIEAAAGRPWGRRARKAPAEKVKQ